MAAFKRRRMIDALANWRTAWNIRRQGKKYREVGAEVGVSESRAAVLCYNYEEYLINQRTKKAA